MGEPDAVWTDRIRMLTPYQVNAAAMAKTGNPDVKFLHCLPAFHDRQTEVGEAIFKRFGLEAMEVTDAVFESPASIVFDQAENRLHTIKAVMVSTSGIRRAAKMGRAMQKPLVLIALGGNALIQKGQRGTAEEQFANLKIPCGRSPGCRAATAS